RWTSVRDHRLTPPIDRFDVVLQRTARNDIPWDRPGIDAAILRHRNRRERLLFARAIMKQELGRLHVAAQLRGHLDRFLSGRFVDGLMDKPLRSRIRGGNGLLYDFAALTRPLPPSTD